MYRRCDTTWLPSGRPSTFSDIFTTGGRLCRDDVEASPPPSDPDMDGPALGLWYFCGRSRQPFPRRDVQRLSLQHPVYSQRTTRERHSGCIRRCHTSGLRPVSTYRLSFDYHISAELCHCQLTRARDGMHEGTAIEITLENMSLTTTDRSRVPHKSILLTCEPCLVPRKLADSPCSHGRYY